MNFPCFLLLFVATINARLGLAFTAVNSVTSSSPSSAEIPKTDISFDPVQNGRPQDSYDAVITGGGPAGLLTAIMLSQKYGPSYKIALCERRPSQPPNPLDETVWNDVARFYLLGIGHRGQTALKKFGVWDDFHPVSVEIKGRRDWQPGQSKVEDGKVTPARKEAPSRVLPREKLVGVLYHHLVENYVAGTNSSIAMLYGYQVDPIDFGIDKKEAAVKNNVLVRISKCMEYSAENLSEDDVTCDVDKSQVATTKLLIGADGSARTVATAMEETDKKRYADVPLWRRFMAPKPFRVTKFVDDNPRVYKSVPIPLPPDWPCDLNYSARSRESRVTLEALPSDSKGNLCALLLMKPDDELSKADVDPADMRQLFLEEFPQFNDLVTDQAMAELSQKPASSLPSFRYAGPRLHLGDRSVILGDAAHLVKPYYGLGANSALEDVVMLSEALDEAATHATGTSKTAELIPDAIRLFSKSRAPDSKALVTISRNMDRPGKLFFVNFLLPLILDGIFHKLAPSIFGPNMFAMFQRKGITFRQMQKKKRLDRLMQGVCLTGVFASAAYAAKSAVVGIAKITGQSASVVSATLVASVAAGLIPSRLRRRKDPKPQ